MKPEGAESRGRAADWDVYWRGTEANAAHREGGPQEPVLAQFWGRFFGQHLSAEAGAPMLDLACGNGAVTGYARQSRPGLDACCSDYSESALRELRKRHPGSRCVVADALNPPFPDGSFPVVASQFGVEYAGAEAVVAAGRLVAPGGWPVSYTHLRAHET